MCEQLICYTIKSWSSHRDIYHFLVLAAQESELKEMRRRVIDLEELPKQHEAAKADLNTKLKNSDEKLQSANKCANN